MPNQVMPRRRTYRNMINVISRLGLQSSLVWVIDAGDADSISSASNQTLGTLPAGGVTFTRGPDTGVDTGTDAQHVGVIGLQSSGEYWSTKVNAAATATQRLETAKAAWSNNAHRDSALFTFAGWFYCPAAMNGATFFDTLTSSTSGVQIGRLQDAHPDGPDYLSFLVYNSGSVVVDTRSTNTIPDDAPTFVAVSIDEAGSAFRFAVNGAQNVRSLSYSSPSAGDSTRDPRVLCVSGLSPDISGRVYNAAWWNRALSEAELTALYNATRAKFGL